VKYSILHNGILSWLLGYMKCLPKRQGLNSAEFLHSHRTYEAVSASVLSHAAVAVCPQYCLVLPQHLCPLGASRQLSLSRVHPAFLRGSLEATYFKSLLYIYVY
jgi:hypothetical protein